MDKYVLVTGGTGYIGSHTAVALLEAGYQIVIIDNLNNSSKEVLSRIEEITGTTPPFVQADLRDTDTVHEVFEKYSVTSVMHFAGHKAVGESVENPSMYYANNIGSTLSLIEAMQAAEIFTLIFSSSATVYSSTALSPFKEETEKDPINPYGMTKYLIEQRLTDLIKTHADWRIGLLRYFNPLGAHPTGRLGETSIGTPNNLMPYLMQVASGKLPKLKIFGDDYDTPDGTCIRDYIHVADLAKGHLAALQFLKGRTGAHAWNLGTGKGTSVLELVETVEKVIGYPINREITSRREGDVIEAIADPSKAYAELLWRAELTIDDMCKDSWNWQQQNPDGYSSTR
ncbi:MAG: UDP-glucose 4-epimerase GalE [Acidimicrobiales bacterium]|nr:UDP-glucose 4-epimerase GalE [Acidimicrobiales bacterium]MDG1846826.1 UDP-glucose 4-epimerase GalE [Acidimicrobiales bacterium]